MSVPDWDDLRYALAIGTAGSLAGAARTLGVNHTTVLRRLDALEAQLGTRLFDRKRGGYQPTEAGLALVEQARHMATRADEVERQVLGRDRELTGVLRVTTAFVLMDHLLPQPLADFARAYPGIEVEVIENAFLVDLSSRHADPEQNWTRREADVALRLSENVAEHLVGRRGADARSGCPDSGCRQAGGRSGVRAGTGLAAASAGGRAGCARRRGAGGAGHCRRADAGTGRHCHRQPQRPLESRSGPRMFQYMAWF